LVQIAHKFERLLESYRRPDGGGTGRIENPTSRSFRFRALLIEDGAQRLELARV
jgi:hypothetical protein